MIGLIFVSKETTLPGYLNLLIINGHLHHDTLNYFLGLSRAGLGLPHWPLFIIVVIFFDATARVYTLNLSLAVFILPPETKAKTKIRSTKLNKPFRSG